MPRNNLWFDQNEFSQFLKDNFQKDGIVYVNEKKEKKLWQIFLKEINSPQKKFTGDSLKDIYYMTSSIQRLITHKSVLTDKDKEIMKDACSYSGVFLNLITNTTLKYIYNTEQMSETSIENLEYRERNHPENKYEQYNFHFPAENKLFEIFYQMCDLEKVHPLKIIREYVRSQMAETDRSIEQEQVFIKVFNQNFFEALAKEKDPVLKDELEELVLLGFFKTINEFNNPWSRLIRVNETKKSNESISHLQEMYEKLATLFIDASDSLLERNICRNGKVENLLTVLTPIEQFDMMKRKKRADELSSSLNEDSKNNVKANKPIVKI